MSHYVALYDLVNRIFRVTTLNNWLNYYINEQWSYPNAEHKYFSSLDWSAIDKWHREVVEKHFYCRKESKMSKYVVMGWIGNSRFEQEVESREEALKVMDYIDVVRDVEKKGKAEESDWPKLTEAMKFLCQISKR